MMYRVAVTLTVIFLTGSQCSDLTAVTQAVFGEDALSKELIPAAFGDFNSDKLTDLIVFDSQGRTVAVLLASEQSVVPTDSSPMFRTDQKNLNCSCPDGDGCKFVSAAPGDFDGDGSMDLMTVSVKDDVKSVHIMWGQLTKLECTKQMVTIPNIYTEPLVFDYNKDSVSDLLTVDSAGNRTVYVFPKARKGPNQKEYLKTAKTTPLKAEHGNSFVDITGDGMADLVLTTSEGLEMYEGVNDPQQFKYLSTIQWPQTDDCNADQCVGQPVWMDFSLSGYIHMVLPVCGDPLCEDSRLYLVPVDDLSKKCSEEMCPWSEAWPPMSLDLGEMLFKPRDPSKSPLQLLTPRVGDVDLDGFPDLLMTMYNKSGDVTKQGEVQLLLNAPCGPDSGCHPYWRQFQLQRGYTAGLGTAVTGAFFDLYEDGKMDLLVVSQNDQGVYSMSAFTNTTQDSDAYFMKVIVLTGACYHNCDGHDSRFMPYGTNSGGQLVSYQSQRPGQETFDSYQSVAVQLPQTSHYALALPYTIFGLGMAPNFVDYLTANVSGNSKIWPQIIPNSQLYVIPYTTDISNWDLKLMITTSKNIVITGLALVGTCALCSVIIVMLHIREKRQDRMAKLQDMKGFHFDAM